MEIVIVKYPRKENKISTSGKLLLSLPFVSFAIMMLITIWDAATN